ncbi:CHAP domain-containing protein [Luethyella okanaganae]|uniref:CHAP domain-containing protein n=1 Tax=Luethyella okanaganae TaxID=69372 RepID=A0ABW1VGJ6_9MICO
MAPDAAAVTAGPKAAASAPGAGVTGAPDCAEPAVPVAPPASVLSVPAPSTPRRTLPAAVSTAPPTESASARSSARRSPLSLAVTLLVVPGLFLTAALPAYAFTPGTGEPQFETSDLRDQVQASAQSVDVSSLSAQVSVSRDGYSAVSADEIRRLTTEAERIATAQAAGSRTASSGSYSTPGVRQEGDDYPWPWELTDNQGGGLSPLGYYYRECVDFVAWRLNRDAGSTGSPWRWKWSNLTPSGGSAYNWANAWQNHGWATSHDPVPGAVAWFTGNHVAYVQAVNGDGTVTLEEYNWGNDHAYHRRTVPSGEVPLYLYPPL